MADPVLDQLDALGVSYEVVPCNPDLADTAAFCDAYGYEMSDSANAIIPLELWIDSRVMERKNLIIGGGTRDRKLLLPPATLLAHPDASVIEDLAKPIAVDG